MEHKSTEADYMTAANVTRCHYCGKEKEGLSFYIGASNKKDWCMIEGTGLMSCPNCYDKAMAEGQARIERHIFEHNAKCEIKSMAKSK